MTNFLTLSYWLDLRPEMLVPYAEGAFVGFIVFLAILAITVALIKSRGGIYRGFFNRLYSFCLANAIIGSILLFFNYEAVPFFSARFWLGLWALIMVGWLIFILLKLKVIPARKKQVEQEKELKKYLP